MAFKDFEEGKVVWIDDWTHNEYEPPEQYPEHKSCTNSSDLICH